MQRTTIVKSVHYQVKRAEEINSIRRAVAQQYKLVIYLCRQLHVSMQGYSPERIKFTNVSSYVYSNTHETLSTDHGVKMMFQKVK